ncbi:MAG: YchJ family metal-binding protein, partial [Campylobacterota bacterium]|nr:YchJ family metal-binding protein [Campylobacterota bacterium]
MKLSLNSKCPCGSGNKYKKCCQPFHKGILPQTALQLMRSRYCAFSITNYKYIIKT